MIRSLIKRAKLISSKTSSSLKECIIQNHIQDIGKIKPVKKMVNLHADRMRWIGALKSVDDVLCNDPLSISLNYFNKDGI